ncbi:hypothetical protein XOCgx_4807 [Xanthomonas oryzae pv. oryzicola]|nr:hypothetical protein XOCgx_4807 [Xanthomonas oryzae pv. oryzicola]
MSRCRSRGLHGARYAMHTMALRVAANWMQGDGQHR